MKCNTCSTDNVEGAHFCANCGAVLTAAPAATHSLVGQVVGGRYTVKRVLGEGGMGIVYEAEQPMGSAIRKVALKTLHAHLSHDPSVSQRFHRECGTISQLEHPNTIKVYDFGATSEGTLYIAMEFVAGKALAKLIEESGPLPPDRVLKIMRQITGSLHEAHEQGIIHRDLKPDNVILTSRAGETDVVKLLDFGIAARTDSTDAQKEQKLTQQGMVLGTPPYMSPEQFTGKALDVRSDVYSLGVMAYEMITGRLPFDANTPWQWATEHMTAKPLPFEATPVSSQIPATMRDAILRSLAKNRDERQASAKQFFEELSGAGAAHAPAPSSGGSSGTAAMAAAPNFGAASSPASGTARTAAMATPAAGSPAPTPAVSAAIPGAPRPRSGGSGKGLIIGLASVGGILVIGIVIVAARSMKPAQEETPPGPTAAPSAPATIAPIETAEPTAPPVTAEPETTETAPQPSAEGPKAKPQTGTGSGTGTKPQPSATPSAAPPAPGGCAGCLSAASAGNYSAAASAYKGCSDAAQKTQCVGMLRGRMPAAAKVAAFNGDCPKAKSIVASGQSMGIQHPDFNAALNACKGK
jgi:serine/threonine-protein kinase